ncbi:MAG: NUDIX hydrolase N-terminal domain-containing protein [Gemmatimonadota bacterium]|nr:NUDIX hydrolase N-terminal domain-containing protein [Gemmatimonadota bacterium]
MDVASLLDELQALGRSGLAYAKDPFDRERYERLIELSAAWYGKYLNLPAPEIRRRWAREFGQITPKVGAEAAIFDEEGRVLLVRRADDGLWGLPAGWLEPNETPGEGARRETREETGLEVRIVQLVDVFTRKARDDQAPQATVAIVYLCEPLGGTLRISHESTDLGYFRLEEVPAWHGWHAEHAAAAHRAWRARQGK